MSKINSTLRLSKLREQEEELKRKIIEATKEAKVREEKDFNRKARLVGIFMLNQIEENPKYYKDLVEKFNATITAPRDRALFGFNQIKPLVESKNQEKVVGEGKEIVEREKK